MKTKMAIRGAAVVAAGAIGVIAGGILSSRTATAGAADDWADLPKPVRASFETQRPGEVPGEVERETEKGRVVYEAEYRSDKGNQDITVDDKGTLVVVKTKLDPKDLPEEIRKAVDAQYPRAKIREAESTNLGYYELDLRSGLRKVEIIVQPDGTISDNPEEDDDDGEEDDDDEKGEA